MKIVGIDHVSLAIPAGAEAAADRFYCDVLGLAVEPKPPVLDARGGRWYHSDGTRIHVGVDHDFHPAQRAHPGLLIADLDSLVTKLANGGFAVEWDDNVPGVRRCYVCDPFGNRIELIAADLA